jgi:hypothetical protein
VQGLAHYSVTFTAIMASACILRTVVATPGQVGVEARRARGGGMEYLPPTIGQLPNTMRLCREHALLGNYQVALDLHMKVNQQVSSKRRARRTVTEGLDRPLGHCMADPGIYRNARRGQGPHHAVGAAHGGAEGGGEAGELPRGLDSSPYETIRHVSVSGAGDSRHSELNPERSPGQEAR